MVDDDGRQVGLCVRDDRGRRGGTVGGERAHGLPRVVVAVIVAAVSWRDGSAKRNEARRGCGGGVGLLLSFAAAPHVHGR